MNDYDDHKTFIPGVGLLVTSWDGSESFIVPADRFENDERVEYRVNDIDAVLTKDEE